MRSAEHHSPCSDDGSSSEEERWAYILKLDEELLLGSVMLSEWATFLARDAETAYAGGAFLSAILTAMAVVETHLRSEYEAKKNERLVNLIDMAAIEEDLREELQCLRKYRNKWVHVEEPSDDQKLLDHPEQNEQELRQMAGRAMKAMLRTLYCEQGL